MLHFPWNITDSKQDQQGRDKTTALVHYLKKISKVKEFIYIYIYIYIFIVWFTCLPKAKHKFSYK